MLNFNCNIRGRKLVKVGDKVVGYLSNNKFIKSVIGSKHQLRKPPAWAIDAGAFDNQIRPNVTEIIIIDKETGIEYYTSADNFDEHKFEFDRRFGRQYGLTLNHWEVRGNGHQQLSLWGGEVA